MSQHTTTDGSYELRVKRAFVAQHYLTVPDPEPPEGEPHSHQFTVEAVFGADELGEYGYLVNINDVETALDGIEQRYRDTLLNDCPAFEGLNPSVEHFSRIVCQRLAEELGSAHPEALTVRIWEDDLAWASYSTTL